MTHTDCDKFLLTEKEYKILKRLKSPKVIQDFLDTFPINHESRGETYMSVRRTVETRTAHCLEGALVAALALWIQGQPPLILDLKSTNGDDHILAIYKQGGRWGSISKTNHATLRFRDPVYKTVRELVLSFFHEYIHLKTGEKILESYSDPVDLRRILAPNKNRKETMHDWITGDQELFWLAEMLDTVPHHKIYPSKNKKLLRKADYMELKAGRLLEWKP